MPRNSFLSFGLIPLRNNEKKTSWTFQEAFNYIAQDRDYPLNKPKPIEPITFFEDPITNQLMNEPCVVDVGGIAFDLTQLDLFKNSDKFINPYTNVEMTLLPLDFNLEQKKQRLVQLELDLKNNKKKSHKQKIRALIRKESDQVHIFQVQNDLREQLDFFVSQHEKIYVLWKLLQNFNDDLNKLEKELLADRVSPAEIKILIAEQQQLNETQKLTLLQDLHDALLVFVHRVYHIVLTSPHLTHKEKGSNEYTLEEIFELTKILDGPMKMLNVLELENEFLKKEKNMQEIPNIELNFAKADNLPKHSLSEFLTHVNLLLASSMRHNVLSSDLIAEEKSYSPVFNFGINLRRFGFFPPQQQQAPSNAARTQSFSPSFNCAMDNLD